MKDSKVINVNEHLEHAKYQMIAIDKIRPNPFQPRRIFDEQKLAELSQSIEKSGLYQPLILRQPLAGIERYEIIAGERRYKASVMAGLKEVPALIQNLSDQTTMEAAIIENLQREDLGPLEEAQAYQSMMHDLRLTQEQVAQRLGKSRPYIANCLRLLGLPTKVKELVENGELSMGQARTLLGLKKSNQLEKLALKTVRDGLTVRQLEAAVSEINQKVGSKQQTKSKVEKSPFIREIESQLEDRLGTKAQLIEKNKKQGKLEISYESMDDLDRILELLDISLD